MSHIGLLLMASYVIMFMFYRGMSGDNKYGADPLIIYALNHKNNREAKRHFGTSINDPLDRLQKLAELKKSGTITDREFAEIKSEILGKTHNDIALNVSEITEANSDDILKNIIQLTQDIQRETRRFCWAASAECEIAEKRSAPPRCR
ncbi:hypothetical protein FACS189487_06300 [Campylobacterota bacterium]|nr:hypothetical protein FACS189487_06300 [Campylobacterota bacterium]